MIIHELYTEKELKSLAKSRPADPCVLYFVVNKDIQLSNGKFGAQVGHAMQLISEYVFNLNMSNHEIMSLYRLWKDHGSAKIFLTAHQNDFDKIKQNCSIFLVKDAGLNEVETGTETVLTFLPTLKSKAPKELKRLQLL